MFSADGSFDVNYALNASQRVISCQARNNWSSSRSWLGLKQKLVESSELANIMSENVQIYIIIDWARAKIRQRFCVCVHARVRACVSVCVCLHACNQYLFFLGAVFQEKDV